MHRSPETCFPVCACIRTGGSSGRFLTHRVYARCRYKCGSGAPVACSCYSHYSVSSTSGKESALPREKGKSCPALHLERYMYRAHRSRLALFVDPPQLTSNSNSLSRIKAHQ